MKTIIAALSVVLMSSAAWAKPSDVKKYKEAFPDKAAQASCKTCHTQGKELNDFGKAYKAAGLDFSKMKQ